MTSDEPREPAEASDPLAYRPAPRAERRSRAPRPPRPPADLRWQDVVLTLVSRTEIRLFDVMYRLPREYVDEPVEPGGVTIGWLLWHLTRDLDQAAARRTGDAQRWTAGGWPTRWGLDLDDADPDATQLRTPGYDAIAGYHQMVTGWLRRDIWTPAENDADNGLVAAAMRGVSDIGQAELLRDLHQRRRGDTA